MSLDKMRLFFQEMLSKEQYPHYSIEKFNYSEYPEHFDIAVNSGEYAWKPIIIRDSLERYKQSVCWMDAGNRVIEALTVLLHMEDMVDNMPDDCHGFVFHQDIG